MPDDDDDRDVWRLVVNGEKWKEEEEDEDDDDDDAPKWDSALLRETMEHRE